MADNYTQMSCQFYVTPEQSEALAAAFDLSSEAITDNNYPPCLQPFWPTAQDFLRDLTGEPSDDTVYFGLDYARAETDSYWVAGDNVVLQPVAQVIQTICKPNPPIVMEWAFTCSKPLVGEFGGGVCVIFADRLVWSNTSDMAQTIINQYPTTI